MTTPLPKAFVESMREQLGEDAECLFEALDTEPAVSIRLNPAKPANTFDGEQDFVVFQVGCTERCYIVKFDVVGFY